MNAREFFEHRSGPEAPPVEAPPETTPDTAPAERPPVREQPSHNPWRRREIQPGEEPHPKAAYGMDTTYTESARRVVSTMLEDDDGAEKKNKKYLRKGILKPDPTADKENSRQRATFKSKAGI